MAESGSFTVNGRSYSLPDSLTMGEMCDAEQNFGVEFGKPEASGARMASALVWIAIRREDPSVTVEDIRDLPAEVFAAAFEAGDASPPADDRSESEPSSGAPSALATASRVVTPEATGNHSSVTGSASDPLTSRI